MVFLLQALFGRGPLRSFQSGDYTLFWLSSVAAIISHMMLLLFRGWVALELTDSPEIVAAAATAGELPSLILSLPGGVLADRFSRKWILIVTEIVTILALLGFVVLLAIDQMEVWSLFVLSAIAGIAFAVAIPSRMAVVPNLVSRDNMANGIALSSIMFSGGMLVGSFIGGRIFDEFGGATAFGTAAVMSIASIVFLLFVNTRQDVREGNKTLMTVWTDTVEGAAFVWRYKVILGLMTVAGVAIIFGSPYQTQLVVFARDVLNQGATVAGDLGAAAGAGSMTGSIVLATFSSPRAIRNLIVFGGIGFAFALIAFSFSEILTLSLLFAYIAGFGFQSCLVATTARAQFLISDSMRGRLSAIRTTTWGASPVGFTMIGWLAENYGAPTATAIMGAITLGLVIVSLLIFRSLRSTAAPDRLYGDEKETGDEDMASYSRGVT
ncbi:MAG: MFS transporter [Chloroflexi bacterium]|nr:MFS transporter [Chloroflexota bacterium]